MNEDFNLPGAQNFSDYLRSNIEGKLEAKGPNKLKDVPGETWVVMVDSKPVGTYTRYDPDNDKQECARAFSGKIPGKVNPLSNGDVFGLIYDKGEDGTFRRDDFNESIPFP
ncbi:MAG TPA: hypothetical protein VJC00_01225 [Candidatus Nanoarchaeia archaeon]|nr:hypothetical protein [Candidatus Nanoarchaeia archaeon]